MNSSPIEPMPLSAPVPRDTLILLTLNLQNDFFHRFPSSNTTMNGYWVGRKDSERVLGFDGGSGPVRQLFRWLRLIEPRMNQLRAQEISIPNFHIFHLRTVVDPEKHRVQLDRFGFYCLAGSDGAALCCGLESGLTQSESVIDHPRDLANGFRSLRRKIHEIHYDANAPIQGKLRVAVIGGWTDEDIFHACYELRTHSNAGDIATCSILTASPSPSQHFTALEQMRRTMRVSVTRTVSELMEWMKLPNQIIAPADASGADQLLLADSSTSAGPEFIWISGSPPRNYDSAVDGQILSHLYRNSSRILIDTLTGGYSASIVLSIQSSDKSRVREAPSVVKLGSREECATEYEAFQRIEEMLGNHAPSVRGFIEFGSRGGIKFRYTKMAGDGPVRRFVDLFSDIHSNFPLILEVVDDIFGEIFSPWYAAAHTEMFDLFSYYFDGFSLSNGEKISRVHQDSTYLKQFISYCLAKPGTEPAPHYKRDAEFYSFPPFEGATFSFPLSPVAQNLGSLFDSPNGVHYLRSLPPRRVYASFSHGDANLQNFIIDPRGNTWVIDFYMAESRNHVLRDLSKAFTCVMFVAFEISSDQQFAQCCLITNEIARSRDLNSPLNEHPTGLIDSRVIELYTILRRFWSHLPRLVKDRAGAVQFQLAIVADCMRFFVYSCRNIYSKRWALFTASILLESILIQERKIHEISPTWIQMNENSSLIRGRLGLTRCPGNRNFLRFERKQENRGESAALNPSAIRVAAEAKERNEVKAAHQIMKSQQAAAAAAQGNSVDVNENRRQIELLRIAANECDAAKEVVDEEEILDLEKEKDEENESEKKSASSPTASQTTTKKLTRLQRELMKLKSEGATHLMILISDSEYKEMGVDRNNLFDFAAAIGLNLQQFPAQSGVLSVSMLIKLVKAALTLLCDERNYSLIIISKGGFHRAGTLAACILCALGSAPAEAIQIVRDLRGPAAIGRDSRESAIQLFDSEWKNSLIRNFVKTGKLNENEEQNE